MAANNAGGAKARNSLKNGDNHSGGAKARNGLKKGRNGNGQIGRNPPLPVGPNPPFPAVFPLQYLWHNRWTLWFYENDRSVSWKKNQKIVSSFKTVEDFWRLVRGIRRASLLRHGYDYSMFRSGILPMWEDRANEKGGRWIIYLEVKYRFCELDRYWLDIMLCLLQEGFKYSYEITGAVVSIRFGGDRIAIWTTNALNRIAIMEIGRLIKERLGLPPDLVISYQTHRDAREGNGYMTYQL